MAVYREQFDRALDQPDFEAKPKVVLIATTPRCGSHLLGHVLGADGRFGVPFEYLNHGGMIRWRRERGLAPDVPLLPLLVRHRTTPNGVFTLKAHWPQFRRSWRTERGSLQRNPKVVIRLFRRDLLSQAVSFDIAAQTGQWIGAVAAEGEPVYDAERIRHYAQVLRQQNSGWSQWLGRRPKVSRLDICYEDFLAGPDQHLEAIRRLVSRKDKRPVAFAPSTERQSGTANRDFKERFRREAGPEDAWILEPQVLPDGSTQP